MRTLYIITSLFLFLCMPMAVHSSPLSDEAGMGEDSWSYGHHAFQVGIGRARQQDTYLSPLKYRGPQVTLMHEVQRLTRMAHQRVSFQSLLEGAFSKTDNTPGTATYWGARLAYDFGWHYHWRPLSGLDIMAGGLMGTDFGLLYNDRNGNNPAQGRLSFDLSASAGGAWSFHLGHRLFMARYQADMPLLGCMFSPQYGQSYYELSQGNRDHNVCFAWPVNAPCLRQMLSLDIPFRRFGLRLSYLSDVRQSRVNHIKMHDISRSFMLGFIRKM